MKPGILTWIALILSSLAYSEDYGSPGAWYMNKGEPEIMINAASFLTKKHHSLINSGFSTFSEFSLHPAGTATDKTKKALFEVSCTVKFDTWEERYDVARVSGRAQTKLVKDFGSYVNLCLTGSIRDSKLVQILARSGGTIEARLLIEQISVEQAGQIKKWLIKQQSGVIQGLFSHMLGNLALRESQVFAIEIPPMPKNTDRSIDKSIRQRRPVPKSR